MPLRIQPKSLRKLVMQCICQSFSAIFYGVENDEDEKILENSGAYLETKNPISHLPSTMLEELAEEMKHLTNLRSHHLHLLITDSLQRWTTNGIADHLLALHFITTRCKNLKTLNMSFIPDLNYKMLMNLMPTLTNIVELDLRMTLAVDEVLDEIGAHCNNLIDLNVSGTPITDKGLVHLCLSSNGECRSQKLVHLFVSETWTSVAGATVVIKFLPNLRTFDFENIFQAIQRAERWDQNTERSLLARAGVRVSVTPGVTTCLSLTHLTSTSESVTEDSLETAVLLCPAATEVAIFNSLLPNESLYKLMLLENLSALSLANSEDGSFTFHEGVLPVLSVCGNRIRSLILSNFAGVDIAGIGRSCLKLQNLALSNVPVIDIPEMPCPDWFNQLEALEFWTDVNIEHSPNLIKQFLLFSPAMQNILFSSCTILTDSLFLEILQSNPLKKLSHLTLDHCHGVTIKCITPILNSDNVLDTLRIWSCPCITEDHCTQVTNRITEERLDIYFEWFQ